MQNRKRLTNILIAGTLTVLLLTVFLAFRGEDTAVANTDVTIPTAVVTTEDSELTAVVESTDTVSDEVATLQAQVTALQAQNEELRDALTTMQTREAEYQAQIEAANQTINELSAQNNTLAFSGEGLGEFGAGQPPHGHNH